MSSLWTQKFCLKEPRSVKCTGSHLIKDCKKPAEAKPKYVHCCELHPASYRGCMLTKELHKLKYQIPKGKTVPSSKGPKAIVDKKPVTSKIVTKAQTLKLQRVIRDNYKCKHNPQQLWTES